MKKELVARVISIVLMASIYGWYSHDESLKNIQKMELLSLVDIAKEAMTPLSKTYQESILLCIAFGVTIIILTELLGFFINIIFFRNLEEQNIIHNHNITLQFQKNPDDSNQIV